MDKLVLLVNIFLHFFNLDNIFLVGHNIDGSNKLA